MNNLIKWLEEKMVAAKEGFDEWKNHNRYFYAGKLEAFREVLNWLKK